MKKTTNILVCGDICPTKDTRFYFEENKVDKLLNNTLNIFQKSDISIANMEFALTDKPKPAIKTGPILCHNTKVIKWFKNLNFTALSLANNHIKDCGQDGVISSLNTCNENGILTVGAGKNEEQAKRPLVIEKNGWKIGIMAFAEHEFNAAYENEAGANLLDVYNDFDKIKKFRKEVDYLIILYHGGIEYYPYPSPMLQKKCHKFIESGADFVTCQHSHLIGTEEDYLHGKILYGQGNTIFGYNSKLPTWNNGLLINIKLNENISIDYIPIETIKNGSIKLCDKNKSDKILNKLNKRKIHIRNKKNIQEKWLEFCKTKENSYLPYLLGMPVYLIRLNKLLKNKIVKIFYSKKQLMRAQNIIRCESHYEVIETILNQKK